MVAKFYRRKQRARSEQVGRLLLGGAPAWSVSGGGKDFSGISLEGADYSNRNLAGKELRGIRGAGASFASSKLASSSFFKADLSE